ncbi:MAG: HEPN domain-containing protein [Cyanobacteria bacterium]|nr:HEPN domain-containing protein [Cyanobacteriota bacterium]
MADPDAMRYLRIAQADLDEARRMVEVAGFRDSSIGFLLQQATEEALKSWIHSRGGLAPFTHDLVALMDWLEESESDLSPFEPIADLTFFAVQTRYDDSLEIKAPDWPLPLAVTSSLLMEAERQLSLPLALLNTP